MTALVCAAAQRSWPQRPPVWRWPLWSAALAALAALVFAGLLLAFHQVVSGSVIQGQARHANMLAQADAAWRCSSLHGVRVREHCLTQLNAPSNGNKAPPAANVAVVAAAAAGVALGR